MNPLTPERLADIEKRCNKFRDSGYMWERFAQYAVVDLGDLLSEIKRLRERDSELTDLLDLAHDDFQRVEALTDDTELRGIALRGQAKIRQNVPVIRQRDELENAVIKLDGLNDQLRAQLSDARAALKVAIDAIENVQADHNEPTSNDGADYRPCDCEICKINTAALQPKE
jgi:hypothetical protein